MQFALWCRIEAGLLTKGQEPSTFSKSESNLESWLKVSGSEKLVAVHLGFCSFAKATMASIVSLGLSF